MFVIAKLFWKGLKAYFKIPCYLNAYNQRPRWILEANQPSLLSKSKPESAFTLRISFWCRCTKLTVDNCLMNWTRGFQPYSTKLSLKTTCKLKSYNDVLNLSSNKINTYREDNHLRTFESGPLKKLFLNAKNDSHWRNKKNYLPFPLPLKILPTNWYVLLFVNFIKRGVYNSRVTVCNTHILASTDSYSASHCILHLSKHFTD